MQDRYWLPRGLIACALMVGAFLFALNGVAVPHSWYPPECCSDRDCKPLAAAFIPKPLPGGDWLLTTGEVVPRAKVKWSPDGFYHLCKLEWEPFTTYCLFVPPQGS